MSFRIESKIKANNKFIKSTSAVNNRRISKCLLSFPTHYKMYETIELIRNRCNCTTIASLNSIKNVFCLLQVIFLFRYNFSLEFAFGCGHPFISRRYLMNSSRPKGFVIFVLFCYFILKRLLIRVQ